MKIQLPSRHPRLEGQHVILREPRESDKADRLAAGQDAEINKMYGSTNAKPMTEETALAWVEKRKSNPLNWIIEYEGKCVGTARLHTIHLDDKRASYAIGMFSQATLGKGIGTEATNLVLQYAFEHLGLHRVGLRVLSYNERAIASYKKAGFIVEGVERESALVEGEWYNDTMMAIIEPDWRKKTA